MSDFDNVERTRIQILDAAHRFGSGEAGVDDLPFSDAGFDAAFRRAEPEIDGLLGGRASPFIEDLLDEASTEFVQAHDAFGTLRDFEFRLFLVVVTGSPGAVRNLATARMLSDLALSFSIHGLATRSSTFSFGTLALPLAALADPSPGRLRRLTRSLGGRAIPGVLPEEAEVTSEILGIDMLTSTRPQVAFHPGTITRAFVGMRSVAAAPGETMPDDWFSSFGDGDGSLDARGMAWERWAEGHYGPSKLSVSLPRSWVGARGVVAADHLIGSLAVEARHLGFDMEAVKGTFHFLDDGVDVHVAMSVPGFGVLGPAVAPRKALDDAMPLLVEVMGVAGRDAVRHADVEGFLHALSGGPVGDGGDGMSGPASPLHH